LTALRLCVEMRRMTSDSLQEILRRIPAVDTLLLTPAAVRWIERTSHAFVVAEIQGLLQDFRISLRSGRLEPDRMTEPGYIESLLDSRIQSSLAPSLKPVINGTGVILHTNLGRAPMSADARKAVSVISSYYTNLEFDLDKGERSKRDLLIESAICHLLDCEAATAVNNNAAAVFLILNTLAAGKEVIVSRGELVEIGGSFRIPDIMARSGAILREVGTTNKTRIEDYREALRPETSMLLRIHPSNFRISGFTARPSLAELSALAHQSGIPLVEDVGSGLLVDLEPFGIKDEPIVRESLRKGADLVCFSCDKLLGGPQAGIIAGKRQWVDPARKNPLMRTFRVDKLIYSALEATLRSYSTGRHLADIPVLAMMSMPVRSLKERSRLFVRRLKKRVPAGTEIDLIPGMSLIGGGSCPDSELPTFLVAIRSSSLGAEALDARLRRHDPAVVLRIEDNRALLDLRTVFPAQEAVLSEALAKALAQ
jgi:L-seryl-tRNA(Ser) seleniumtransferase